MLLNLVGFWLCLGKNTTRITLKMAFSSVYKLAPSALCNCLGFQKSLATALHMVGPFWRVDFLFRVSWSLFLALDSPLIQPCYQLHNAYRTSLQSTYYRLVFGVYRSLCLSLGESSFETLLSPYATLIERVIEYYCLSFRVYRSLRTYA